MNPVSESNAPRAGFWRRVLAALVAAVLLFGICGGVILPLSLAFDNEFIDPGDLASPVLLVPVLVFAAALTSSVLVVLMGAYRNPRSSKTLTAVWLLIPAMLVGNAAVCFVYVLLGWPASLLLSVVLALTAVSFSIAVCPSGLIANVFGYRHLPKSPRLGIGQVSSRRFSVAGTVVVSLYIIPFSLLAFALWQAEDVAAMPELGMLALLLYWVIVGPALTALAFTLMLIPVGNGRRVIDALSGAVAVKLPSPEHRSR